MLHERREAIALLLEYGADPNISDVSGNNSFHIAASDRFDCLELLLKLTDPIAGINTRNYAGNELKYVSGFTTTLIELLRYRFHFMNLVQE